MIFFFIIFFSWSWWMDSNCCWEAIWQRLGLGRATEFPDWGVVWWTTNLSYWSLFGKGIGPEPGNECVNRCFVFLDFFSCSAHIWLYGTCSWYFVLLIASSCPFGIVTILIMYRWGSFFCGYLKIAKCYGEGTALLINLGYA